MEGGASSLSYPSGRDFRKRAELWKVKQTLGFALALLALSGCDAPAAPPQAVAAPKASPSVLGPEKLRTIFPKLEPSLTLAEFRAKPGIVTKHVRKGGELVGTILVIDLLGDSAALKEFDGATQKFHGYPAISTSMGGGVAVLVEGRFRVEVVALAPEVTDAVRARWLEGFAWTTLKGWT